LQQLCAAVFATVLKLTLVLVLVTVAELVLMVVLFLAPVLCVQKPKSVRAL